MNNVLKIFFVNPPEEEKAKISAFFSEISKTADFVEDSTDADISIDFPAEKLECEPAVLHHGGRISCPLAFTYASKMGIERGQFGKFANLLDIKIHSCQLGCFK